MNTIRYNGPALAGLLVMSAPALSEMDFQGERMVVTANRSEQPVNTSLASVSVIDRSDIERSQASDILEILRLEAGIDIARGGGPGGQTSLFMRGSNSNHVLVLIDGARVAAAGTGGFSWELLDPAIIERIEIVRGPRAARWGSDAIGGVIQIFTRQGQGTTLRAAYGRYRDRSLAGAYGNQSFSISAAHRKVGGFSSQNPRGFSFDPDDDGFENFSTAMSGRIDLADGRLEMNARLATGDNEFDQGESEFLNYSGGLTYLSSSNGDWQWQAGLHTLRDRLETETAFGLDELITRRIQAGFQAERRLGGSATILVGADGWDESGLSRGSWSQSRHNLGLWTGIDGNQASFDYEASLRVDRDQRFGSAVTGNLAGGWRPGTNWRIQASIGRGFRAPNFSQLFSPGFSGLFAGNPDLDPETSLSAELGVQWQITPVQQLSLTSYETRIDDLIDFAGPDFQAINIRKARIRGIELAHELVRSRWLSQTRVTWQDPVDRATGQSLLRRARYKASTRIDYQLGDLTSLGAEIIYNGRRFDVGQERLSAYTLINLRASHTVGRGLSLEARLENLGDRNYEPLLGFDAHGRSLFLGLRWDK